MSGQLWRIWRCGWGESEGIGIDFVHRFDGGGFLRRAFPLLLLCKILDGHHQFMAVPSEAFVIEFLDELRQWRFPPLLVVIRYASEFFGIEPIRVRLSRNTLTDSELNQKKDRI